MKIEKDVRVEVATSEGLVAMDLTKGDLPEDTPEAVIGQLRASGHLPPVVPSRPRRKARKTATAKKRAPRKPKPPVEKPEE